MPKTATMDDVLRREYESQIQTDIPSGQWVTLFYDGVFAKEPDIESWSVDQEGLTISNIDKKKDRVRVKFNQILGAGKKLKFKIKPKRVQM